MDNSLITTIITAVLVIILAIMIRREYINESQNNIANFKQLSDAEPGSETKTKFKDKSKDKTKSKDKSKDKTKSESESKSDISIPSTDLNFARDIPPYNAYQLIESPPDQRYQYVPNVNAYLLPYQYLNMQLPYDRWMYYHFPSYYAPNYPPEYTPNLWPRQTYPLSEYDYMNNIYVDNDIYGDNYFFNNYGNDVYSSRGPKYNYPSRRYSNHRYRSNSPNRKPYNRFDCDTVESGSSPSGYNLTKNRSKIAGSINSINVDTNKYPTKESNFDGGWGSQKFANGMSYASGLTSERGTMRGFGGPIDRNRGRNSNRTDKKTSQSYVGGSSVKPRRRSLPGSGKRAIEHFGMTGNTEIENSPAVNVIVSTNFPSIDYNAFDRTYYQDAPQSPNQPPPKPALYIDNSSDVTADKKLAYGKNQSHNICNPQLIENYSATLNSGATVETAIQSIIDTNPYLTNRFGNNNLQDPAEFAEINKYNIDEYRPIGSNRLGRGLGTVTGFNERHVDYKFN